MLTYRFNTVFAVDAHGDVGVTGGTVTAYAPGGVVKTSSTGVTVELYGGHGFIGGEKVMRGIDSSSLSGVITVDSVAGNVLTMTGAYTVDSGDILFNLGADESGTVQVQFDGSPISIYSTPDTTVLIDNAVVTLNESGEYDYWHGNVRIWELIRNGAGDPVGVLMDATKPTTSLVLNVLDYGATGNGVDDDYQAISRALSDALAVNGIVYFPFGNYRVATNITFPYTVGIKVDPWALVSPDTGITVRVQGNVDAGQYPWIGGNGTITFTPATNTEVLYGPVGIREAPIQWWNCIPVVTTDCGPAIIKALNAVAPGTFLTFYGGTFKINTPIAVQRRYFNMRGETGGYHPGAGYPTFIWTGADNGTMFTFTEPFGIKVEMCAFDGDFSAATVFKAQARITGAGAATTSWNCHWDRCTFTACRGDSFVMGGAHEDYDDDFLQALFTQCWFDRPQSRASDADGNAVTMSAIPAGRHFLSRAWNSWNVRFENCHFFSLGTSSDADQKLREGIRNEGGELVFQDCFFYNIGTDIIIATPPDPTSGMPYIRIYGGESQSEELIRFATFSGFTPVRNYFIQAIRHVQSFDPLVYTPTRTTSIFWEGTADNTQSMLVLDGCTFNHDVQIGNNMTMVLDSGCRFAAGKGFTGNTNAVFGLLGSRATTGQEAYGRSLRLGANIMRFGPTAPTGHFSQHDVWMNNQTDDLTLTRDFLQKRTQASGSTGQTVPFFGSHNYEGDVSTSVNGTANFVHSFSTPVLTMTTKIIPVKFAIYELIWSAQTGETAGENDMGAGVGYIYVMRDKVGGNNNLYRISYRAVSDYDNQGNGSSTILTITAQFWDGATASVTIADGSSDIASNYKIRLLINNMVQDRATTFYGIIRRIK